LAVLQLKSIDTFRAQDIKKINSSLKWFNIKKRRTVNGTGHTTQGSGQKAQNTNGSYVRVLKVQKGSRS
jgi:hypothetical protein